MNVDMDRMWEKVTDWIGRMLRRFPQLKEERKSEKQNRKKLYLMVQKRKIKSWFLEAMFIWEIEFDKEQWKIEWTDKVKRLKRH